MAKHEDIQFITDKQIYDIRIAEAMNDTANSNVFTVTFKQHIHTKTDAGETYFGQIQHRFPAESFEAAIAKIKKTAAAYHNPIIN